MDFEFNWNSLFGSGGPGEWQNANNYQQPQEQPQSIPPAAPHVVKKLPLVTVRPEDLAGIDNGECCICLEPMPIDSTATRLPCGHFYHTHCVHSWLSTNCACPMCRYELPTNDATFEVGRKERMRHRKPRYTRATLERMKVKELKSLLRRSVLPSGIVEKGSLIDYLVRVGDVEFIHAAAASVAYRLEDLKSMSVKELRRVMNQDAGVFFDPKDVVEKADMIRIFIDSGRLEVLAE